MSEDKYTEEEKIFIKEQYKMLSREMDKIYDDIFNVITKLETKDAVEIMKMISESHKKQ